MRTQVDVMKFSKQLRDRLRALQSERPKALAKFDSDVKKWQRDMVAWVAEHAESRIKAVTRSDIRERARYRSDRYPTPDAFFAGCPVPPSPPSDKAIKKIQATLRHVAITGQKLINVDTDEIANMFGTEDEDES